MSILAPAVIEVKQQHNTVKLYWAGWDAYVNLQPLEEMATPGERAGWWAANRAEGECVTSAYLNKKDA